VVAREEDGVVDVAERVNSAVRVGRNDYGTFALDGDGSNSFPSTRS
jgi:hypothetical protein